jgi:hypothetical protein
VAAGAVGVTIGLADVEDAFALVAVAAGRATAEFGGGFPDALGGFTVTPVLGCVGVAGADEAVDDGELALGAGCAVRLELIVGGFTGVADLLSALAAASAGVSVISIDSTASRRIMA